MRKGLRILAAVLAALRLMMPGALAPGFSLFSDNVPKLFWGYGIMNIDKKVLLQMGNK